MIFFPTLYPDEMLYSGIARYSIRSGNLRNSHNLEDLFNKRSVAATFELPTQIEELVSNMPVQTEYDSDYLIDKHTLFPIYSAFIPEKRANKIKNDMKFGGRSIPKAKVGIIASNLEDNVYFKFCPKCVEKDIEVFGEPYWHRVHQVIGVFICPDHGIPLYESGEIIRGKNGQRYIAASKENCKVDKEIVYPPDLVRKMSWMSADVKILLDNNFDNRWEGWFKNQFRVRLVEEGYARMNNYIDQKRLIEDFNNYYGEEYLKMTNSFLPRKGYNWLSTIIRDNNKFTYSLRYLLLSRFLNIGVEELFNKGLEPNDINNKVDITEIYQRIWDDKLIELIDNDLSLREIEKILKTSTKTIKKRVNKLGIQPFWKYNGGGKYINHRYIDTKEFKDKRRIYREKWMDLYNKYEEKSSNQLRQDYDGIYSWLYKYDKEWLKKYQRNIKKNSGKMDWTKRDLEMLEETKKIVRGMKDKDIKRITWSTIGNSLGVSGWLEKSKEKLPLTRTYIESVQEDLRSFHIRKVEWGIRALQKENRHVTFWNIVEVTGIGTKYLKPLKCEIDRILTAEEGN